MLPQANRLLSRRDFDRAYRRGKSAATPTLVLYWSRRAPGPPRIGFSISRKVGHAVERNHLRRQLRELTRSRLALFRPGFDYVFVARRAANGTDFDRLARHMDKLLGLSVKNGK